MGCDIHFFTEIKLDGEWFCYGQPLIPRNYDLFGKLAGVRREMYKPIAPARGLPADCSKVVKWAAERWEDDGHNFSYINSEEIAYLYDWWKVFYAYDQYLATFPEVQLGYLNGSDWLKPWPSGVQDVRFVFWFDN